MVYVDTAAKTVISEKHGMTAEVWTGRSVLEVGVLKAVRLCHGSTAGLFDTSPVREEAREYRASLRELSYHKRMWRGRPPWGCRWLSGPDRDSMANEVVHGPAPKRTLAIRVAARISRATIRAPPTGLNIPNGRRGLCTCT